jgi:hypothetical protein
MRPKDVAHQDKVRDSYAQGIPSHAHAVFIGQHRDGKGSNEWEQDNRGQPRELIRHHGSEQKYLSV